jgi:D-beta-D-heptose 7-phosphate kinase / D-beta-D-heptose 1-phosphate adenosyltransferase
MYKKLLKTITNLGSPKVLVVGDFMLDIYTYGDALRISPEAPVPILKINKTEYNCGGAGSVAINLATLGARPICIGLVGEDRNAEILKKLLKKAGADITGLVTTDDRPTITKQRLIGVAQHRHHQQLFRMDNESTEPLSEDQNREFLQLYSQKLEQADIVCIQDHNKGTLRSLCKKMIAIATEAGKKIVIDPSPTSDYSIYSGATIITPNRQEISFAAGFEVNNTKAASIATKQIINELGVEAVIATLDKDGLFFRTKDIAENIPAKVREVYDVSSAGDVVLATVTTAVGSGADYKTAAQLANIAGGLEVEKFGAIPVSIEEIVNEISNQSQIESGKIHQIDSLIQKYDWHRKQNKTIVFTNGCFDVLHRGHIELLKFCKSCGDILVIGLNSDNSVRGIKGPSRPINNQDDRAAVLSAMGIVDYITIFDEPDPFALIKKITPDILIKGQDWADKKVIGADIVEEHGGKVVFAPLLEGKSSTNTIQKIKTLTDNELTRRYIEQDGNNL